MGDNDKDRMSDEELDDILNNTDGPGDAEEVIDDDREEPNIWLRGLFMIIFAILFGIAEWLLLIFAFLQFVWMLFAKERNRFLSDVGESMGRWLQSVAAFQTGATDDKPFPWRRLE